MVGYRQPLREGVDPCATMQPSESLEFKLRAALTERLGAVRFGLWFGDSVRMGLSSDGTALEVRVPNPFFHNWIRDHYSGSLLEAATAVVGRPLQLSIHFNDVALMPQKDAPNPGSALSAPDTQLVLPSLTAPLFPGDSKPPCLISTRPSADHPPSTEQSPSSAVNSHPLPKQALPHRLSTATASALTRPVRRLEGFVVGPGNHLAHAAAIEMARSAGTAFNPLMIHGAVGLGKTHLLEGIGHALKQVHPGLNIMQLTAEAFTNSFLESMRAGSLAAFRARCRGAGGLVVDDIHFLAAKRATQDEFLHTFNTLINKGAPIILAADQHPRLISRLSEELVTRFLGGMLVKIEVPDLATRKAILQAQAAARGVDLPEAILMYIAVHLRSSIRELEGALSTVIAQAALTGKHIDLHLAQSALRDTIRHTEQAIGLSDVERAVCGLFQIDAESLKSDSRTRALAYPRMLAMYLARKRIRASYSEIGQHFGGRNHSTVISAEKKVETWLQAEQKSSLLPGFETVADLLADLERLLGN